MNRFFVYILTAALMAGNAYGATDNQTGSQQLRVERQTVNVRSAPSLKGRVVFQLNRGDVVRKLGKSGNWYKIADFKGREGFVYQTLVTVVADAKAAKSPQKQAVADRTPRKSTRDAASKRRSSKKALLIGGGALAAGTLLFLATRGGGDEDRDDDDDGYSVKEGDCDDGNPAVNPAGSVTATLTSSIAGQSVSCASSSNWRVAVVNNTCKEIDITGLSSTRTLVSQGGGAVCGSDTLTLQPTANTAAPGKSTTIYDTSFTVGCCIGGGACEGYCRFSRVDVVSTSAGQLTTDPVEYQVNYGPDCPPCASFRVGACAAKSH